MKSLKEESIWAFEKAMELHLIDEEDTAVIYQSWDYLENYLNHLKFSFDHTNALHAIAIKTNPHPEVLKKVVSWGFGLEAASIEEVQLALNAGISADQLVFDSPVKTKKEIEFCNSLHGLRFNVNCLEELERIPINPNFNLGIRVNPLVNTNSPDIYSVSKNESKFGVPIYEREKILKAILDYPVEQLHIHSGSHMQDVDAAVSAVKSLVGLAIEANLLLEKNNINRRINCLDIGGGLAPEKITDSKSKMQYYIEKLKLSCPELWDFELITEFGQWIYFYTGFAFSRVEYTLKRGDRNIAFIHLGADYMMRDAYVKPRNIDFVILDDLGNEKIQRPFESYDIAGPLCFAGDYVDKDVILPEIYENDWLGLLGTGSNSYGLWSRHCSRTIPKVIGFSEKNDELLVLSNRFNPFVLI
jgi:diaminopimelate decarboxylase